MKKQTDKMKIKKSCDSCQSKGDCGTEEDFVSVATIHEDYMKPGFFKRLHEFLAENCEGHEDCY